MRLTNFLVRDALIPNLAATATGIDPRDQTAVRAIKQQVIGEMVASLRKAGDFRDDDLQDIVKAVMRREELGTTGIGHGIAIPHSRHQSVDRLIGTLALCAAACRSRAWMAIPCTCFSSWSLPRIDPGTICGPWKPLYGRCATKSSFEGFARVRQPMRFGRYWRTPRRVGRRGRVRVLSRHCRRVA